MERNVLSRAAEFIKAQRRKKRWTKAVSAMAAVVVFCTTYALILPAITLQAECGKEDHTHSDACYTVETVTPQPTMLCSMEALREAGLHEHDDGCYDDEEQLICGFADFVVHEHDKTCYDLDGKLICTLEEIEEHQHDRDCYTREKTLVCQELESDGHRHDDGCYEQVRGDLICTSEEEDHEHSDDCYEWSRELVCDQEETQGYTHSGDCYETEWVLDCDKPEIELHEHDEDCYDDGVLTCGKIQVTEHVHDDDCIQPPEGEPYEVRTLTCGKEEHEHAEACYLTEPPVEEPQGADEEAEADAEDAEETSGQEPAASSHVQGTAYASRGAAQSYSMMLLDDAEDTADPLDVEGYVTGATLYYRTDENAEWTDVEGATEIPGDADFKLVINYGNVKIADLLAADGKMTYTLPNLLRNAVANGKITSGSTEVGTITASGETVTLAFDTAWLREQSGNNAVINGDFYVEAEADLSQIGDGNPGKIVVGDVEIEINFDSDIIAQYGDVDIAKTVSAISEKADGDYLTYTLTVTAGADGCPEVKVVDTFASATYIKEYVGVTGTSTATNDADGPQETSTIEKFTYGTVYLDPTSTDTTPGTLVWVIGGMEANETRTLIYRVKLKDEYTGIKTKGNLQNTATVYSKTYQRDSDTANFTPKAEATMSKMAADFTPNGTGGGTITYTIWVHADAGNSYTLDNVKIVDALDGSQDQNPTLPKIRQYLSYNEGSFHLYRGGSKNQNGSSGLTESQDGTGPTLLDTDNDGKYNDSFTYYVGSLAPGESKTLTYTVNVEAGVFVEAGNESVPINNRACIHTDDTRENGGQALNAYNRTQTLGHKIWDRKLAGEKLETEKTISMNGSVYDATGASVTSITNPGSFTVPAGSYQYQVVANEAGDWNLSSASMSDTLSGSYMQFVGYVQVNAYTIEKNDNTAPGSDLTDAAAIANLSARTPAKTVWVKVDGKTSFHFTPGDIGLGGTYAYLLTYYAQPVNTDNITQVIVDNTFSLDGTVGIGGGSYTLAGIQVKASVTVEGSNSFSAQKQSWYYEAPKVTSGDFANGALYWVIKVDGSQIPGGTQFQDLTSGTPHYIRSGSLVGVYTGSLGDKSIADFDNYTDLLNKNLLTPLKEGEGEDFSVKKENTSLKVTLQKKINLNEGESLYIILKTEPSSLPKDVRDSKVFNNTLKSSFNGTDWIEHNMASQTLYGSENTFKELGRVFTYSGSGNITVIKEGTKQAIDTAALKGTAGTFTAWQIHVNYEGNLSGQYRVVEDIPAGMEVSYVRIWWAGSKVTAESNRPTTPRITNLGSEWTEHILDSTTNGIGNQKTYYYTNGQQVIWDVGNLSAGNEKDTYAVEYQIVCRVTDPDVLRGGEAKEFNNTVSLYTTEGQKIGSDSNGVTIQKQTLSKTGTYDPEVNGGRYPFKIILNELGEDLVSGADTITLVDELSDTLILDTTSIKVVNTKTGQEVTGWTSSVEGQTLKLVLPDNLPLTVTYETSVNAPPGQTISISNQAHWEGYTTPSGGSVEDSNFAYEVGGTVGVDTYPSITIKKLDQYNTSTALSGAAFKLVEGAYADGTFTATENGLSLTGTTSADGTLTFGKDSGKTMKYNTVYCLTETKAPKGYVLDAEPHYFAVAKQVNGKYPTFPAGVTVWYQGADYTYQAYNHKGEATVEKKFADAGDQALDKIDGIYKFGIFDNATPTGDLLQTVTITYGNGTVTPEGGRAKFTNLELGKTYYIYELDDDGQPIKDGALAAVDGKIFEVTYTGGPAVTVPADGTAAVTVTVTNRVHYTVLPETGGAGTLTYTTGGAALMAGALGYVILRKRKEEL